jgi:chromosome segregation ATPase
MPVSGPEALRSIEEAVRDIRSEEDDISKRLARSAERVAKIREGEAELFMQLAKTRLDPAAQAELAGKLSAAEKRAHAMLQDHAEAFSKAESQLSDLDERLTALSEKRAQALAEVDRHQAELRALSDRIAAAVAQDPAYGEQRKKAEELQSVASQSLSKTEQAELDREEKGKPNRTDPLFMYLWELGYGTRNYSANNLQRWLDAKVARIVRYDDARPNFAMLNEIPLRLREHAERQQVLAEAAEDELDVLETRAIDAAGGGPIRKAISKAQAEMEGIDEQVVSLEDERDERAQELRQLSQGSDTAFSEAVGALAQSLEHQDISVLLAQARATTSPEDDAMVAKIDDGRHRIAEEETEAKAFKDRLKVLSARRRELEDIEWEFKKARYDDPRSSFRENNLTGDMLTEFLRGAITAAAYWDQWRRSQSWSPGTTDWGGGFGLPRGGRGGFNIPTGTFGSGSKPRSSGSSGGFSRPRTGSRGTRRHGGFKTGGRF